MYSHPGKVLKGIATAFCVIGIIISVVLSIIFFTLNQVLLGIIALVAGVLGAYVGALRLAAFGELVENSTTIAYYVSNGNVVSGNTYQMQVTNNNQTGHQVSLNTSSAPKNIQGIKICSVCGTKNSADRFSCQNCGMGLPSTIQSVSSMGGVGAKFNTCSNCGTENRVSERYCSVCGKQI